MHTASKALPGHRQRFTECPARMATAAGEQGDKALFNVTEGDVPLPALSLYK